MKNTENHPQLVAVGQQIKRLRIESGYKQKEVARRAGLDRSYVGGVERGRRNPGLVNVIRIAAALDVEVGELFPAVETLPPAP